MEPWKKFRDLCQYYIDCVKYSGKSQELLLTDQLNKQFMIPKLPIKWHLESGEFYVDTNSQEAYIRNVLLKERNKNDLFIGYPLHSVVSTEGVERLCPAILFPVRVSDCETGMKMRIDRKGISINQDWINNYAQVSDRKVFCRAFEQCVDEIGCVDVEQVLNYIRVEFKACIDPNAMQHSVRHADSACGMLNTPILFVGTNVGYTKTLLAELRQISREPDVILDKTALAYVFREPQLKSEMANATDKKIPVSFTERAMNAGQFEAVEASLNDSIVKVIGPPGTGKSFMSVNLIANEVLNGGSVLFTSKNHKAIHSIFDKAADAIKNRNFSLVAFCTTPNDAENINWYESQKRVDERVARVRNPPQESVSLGLAARKMLDVSLSVYREAETHIFWYQQKRQLMSQYQRILEKVNDYISQSPAIDSDDSKVIELLERLDRILQREPPVSLWERLALMVKSLFHKSPCKPQWQELLENLVPHVANAVVSRRTARNEVERSLQLFRYREVLKRWEKSELAVINHEDSECNYDAVKEIIGKSLAGAAKAVQDAYVATMVSRVSSVESSEYLVEACKESIGEMRSRPIGAWSGIDEDDRYAEVLEKFEMFHNVFPAWASTILSLRRAAPCIPGVFSLAIIDEASQCEIPSMIPVLFRARRVVAVGDPNQFPPVVELSESRDFAFRRRYHIEGAEYSRFAYRGNNIFSVVPGKAYLLNEHFRCADAIADYFNDEFYGGQLSLCCPLGRDGDSLAGGIATGMLWVDAPGGDAAEFEAALEYLKELKRRDFKGTIGVISPLRGLVNRFKTIVADNRENVPSQLDVRSQINTANGFQGGECDVVLFLLGLNDGRKRGEDWYITAPENKYIFNVSVSRAKRLFVAFGDKKKVAACGLSYVQKLIPEARPQRQASVGLGEIKLKHALSLAGIETKAQYPVLNRYLDLAIPEYKIDIEVDGQAWHLDRNGCRKPDDIHRDTQLEAAGWRVVRLWHSQVVNDITGCVEKVKRCIVSRCVAKGERGL